MSNSEWIYDLQPRQFNYKKSLNHNAYGFIAEEVDEIGVNEASSLVGRKNIGGESVPDYLHREPGFPLKLLQAFLEGYYASW